MKLLYQGELRTGTTSLQRAEAFSRVRGVELVKLHTGAGADLVRSVSLYYRVRWKLRWPIDDLGQNEALLDAVSMERPDAVIVDNSKVMRRATLAALRALGVRCLCHYTPDDVMGRHNLSWPLKASFPDWDVFFTTKTFNVPELEAAGVRNVVLIGKAYDAEIHRPMSRDEVGAEYEQFDLVFAGSQELERRNSINALAEAGLRVVVYGGAVGGWCRAGLHDRVTLRDAKFAHDYTCALHHGKIALCFLRKINRDRITQRTMEIAAMGRPMLAEKTDEHDAHFVDGREYVGFTTDDDLIDKAVALLANATRRATIAKAALERCRMSGYSNDQRAQQMLSVIGDKLAALTAETGKMSSVRDHQA